MNWRYRRPAAVAVVVLGMAVASACSTSGGGSSGSGSSGGVTTITFWARPQNPSVGLAKRWNATHKNIKVQVTTIPDQEAVTKLGAAVRSHSGPDVVDRTC
jgi:multiple sugar transport system substrate-binding protein